MMPQLRVFQKTDTYVLFWAFQPRVCSEVICSSLALKKKKQTKPNHNKQPAKQKTTDSKNFF